MGPVRGMPRQTLVGSSPPYSEQSWAGGGSWWVVGLEDWWVGRQVGESAAGGRRGGSRWSPSQAREPGRELGGKWGLVGVWRCL